MASTLDRWSLSSFLLGVWLGAFVALALLALTDGFAEAGAWEVCSGFGYPGGAVKVDGQWHCRPAPVLPQPLR